ncbi:MAG TPA: hypothetical protein VJX67_07065, partial [Blastocatellia bacterium]|nr:hypothetical protein [Blastocatellia bacterium]
MSGRQKITMGARVSRVPKPTSATIKWISAACIILLAPMLSRRQAAPPMSQPKAAEPSMEDRWKQAAATVEAGRDGPVGARAKIDIPDALRLYDNPHRFLATQLAESRRLGYQIPNDYPDLAALILGHELVELPMVGNNFVLFGVAGLVKDVRDVNDASEGGDAWAAALTHYDNQTHASIPLFSDESQFAALDRSIAAQIESLENDIAGLTKQLAQAGRRERARRAWLRSQILADKTTLESRAGEKTLA